LTRHAGAEIAARRTQDDDAPARHVLAAVVADGLHDGVDAAVADAETLASDAADVDFAARGPVKRHVADNDVLLGDERGLGRGIDDELAA
jgi:hypothetical protein